MSIIFRPLVEKIGAKLMQTEDAINASKIIVMAVPKDFYVNQPLHLLEGKTVIDCSNRSSIHRKNDEQSQAEYLQSLLPKSPVVKAFNVLSAYALESGGLQGTLRPSFCGLNFPSILSNFLLPEKLTKKIEQFCKTSIS